jgi:hypothetical protein
MQGDPRELATALGLWPSRSVPPLPYRDHPTLSHPGTLSPSLSLASHLHLPFLSRATHTVRRPHTASSIPAFPSLLPANPTCSSCCSRCRCRLFFAFKSGTTTDPRLSRTGLSASSCWSVKSEGRASNHPHHIKGDQKDIYPSLPLATSSRSPA